MISSRNDDGGHTTLISTLTPFRVAEENLGAASNRCMSVISTFKVGFVNGAKGGSIRDYASAAAKLPH